MLCEKMGWTYEELQEQPQFFIERIFAKLSAEGKYREEEDKKAKQRIAKSRSRPLRRH